MGEVINIAGRRKKKQTNPVKPVGNKQTRVLLCAGDDYLADLITKSIKAKNDFQVTSLTSIHEKDLLKAAEDGSFDMFILVLNNIYYHSDKPRAEALDNKPFELISYLRTTYRSPVIALYGYPDDPTYANKAKLGGAGSVLKMPFEIEQLQNAIEKCFR